MTTRIMLSSISVTALAFALAGCGSSVGTGTRSVAADSQACIDCHLTQHAISKVTGANIVKEWQSSRHSFMNAAGCNDCHETTPLHGGNNTCANCHGGSSTKPVTVSDASGKCFKCHGLDHPDDIMVAQAPQHFGKQGDASPNRATNPSPASYLSTQYVGNCRKCHNPHDPTTGLAYNKAWATGGMANVNSGARGFSTGAAGRDFKMYGTPVKANDAFIYGAPAATSPFSNGGFTPGCVRCHTTTGFVNFVTSGFMDLRPFGNPLEGPYTDKTKEVTGCDACHSDYNFKKVRAIGAVRLYFNYSATNRKIKISNIPTDFTNYGKSNTCVPCHAGRGMGNVIKMLDAAGLDFTNSASPSGHDFSGAGTIAGSSGYEFPGREYVTSSPVDIPNPHESIGLSGADPKGPCVSCHMNTSVPADSHRFLPIEHGDSSGKFNTYTAVWRVAGVNAIGRLPVASVVSNTCSTFACHTGAGTSAVTVNSMNEDKFAYISALSALNSWLVQARVTTTNSTTNWEYFGAGSGRDTMGASFNRGLLNNEPGGYTHRPLYVKRLIFDSIAQLAQLPYPAKDALAVKNALLDATVGTTSVNVAASRRLPPEVTAAARNWLFGRYTSANVNSAFRARRPGD